MLWFGACAPTYVLAYSLSLEDALEDAAGALEDHGYKGLFTEPEYEDAFNDLQREGKIPADITFCDIKTGGVIDDAYSEMVLTEAEQDLTYTESGYVASWEWGIVNEDVTKEDILAIAHRNCVWPGKVYSDGSVWTGERCHNHPMT